MLNKFRIYTLMMIVFFLLKNGGAQDNENYVYFFNFVHHSDEQLCKHLPPTTTFTTYLNDHQSKIFLEKFPNWKQRAGPNINGNDEFDVESGNFTDPAVQIGESVITRFTYKETGKS